MCILTGNVAAVKVRAPRCASPSVPHCMRMPFAGEGSFTRTRACADASIARSIDASPSVEPIRSARAVGLSGGGPRLTQRRSAAHTGAAAATGVCRQRCERGRLHAAARRTHVWPGTASPRVTPPPPSRASRPAPGWDRRDRACTSSWCARAHPPAPLRALRRTACIA